MSVCNTIRLYGQAPGSIVDGPGIRYSVFCQGCTHNCRGCHNPQSHRRDGGRVVKISSLVDTIKQNYSTQGVTISGGEPFEQLPAVANLVSILKKLNYNIWVYTGYLYEDLFNLSCGIDSGKHNKFCNVKFKNEISTIFKNIDVLVDGEFDISQKSLDILYRGSKNQRLIDINKTKNINNIVFWDNSFTLPKKPESW